jgi:Holliday junction resolvase
MSNPSKSKGTRAETRVARYMNERGVKTTRRALAGNADEGDLRVELKDGTELTLEVKAGTQTANYGRTLFTKWQEQTIVEGNNSGCHPVLVIVRHRRPLANAEVWMPCYEWETNENKWAFGLGNNAWAMMYLNEFVSWLMEY